ncbi:MAG: sugar phosphate isomerase/epimerase [Firmicutes bacterium]|nr:sugar phosphate isomerase/epimerase [Bacillota bacterium]
MKYYASLRPDHNWEYARKCVEAGIQGFEIINLQSYLPREEFQSYLELAEKAKNELQAGLTVHAPILDVHLGSLNCKIRQVAQTEVRTSLDLARRLEAALVVVHGAPCILTMPGGKWSKQSFKVSQRDQERVEKQKTNLMRSLKELADGAPDVLLTAENLVFPHEMYRSPEEMEQLMIGVNRPNFGFTLDVGHALVSGFAASDYLNLLGKWLVHVHLHDNYGVIDEHLPLGEGVFDYVGFIQSLKKMGYQEIVTLEFTLEDPGRFSRYLL